MGKYADHPVNNYTGTPKIDIALFNIKRGRINLPISLSYHGSGVRVDEIASRSGMGWVLNAGGVITRTVPALRFIATEEGRAVPDGSGGFKYEYALKDHLGDTRVNYPFGLNVYPFIIWVVIHSIFIMERNNNRPTVTNTIMAHVTTIQF